MMHTLSRYGRNRTKLYFGHDSTSLNILVKPRYRDSEPGLKVINKTFQLVFKKLRASDIVDFTLEFFINPKI